jgi:hypothetical protein
MAQVWLREVRSISKLKGGRKGGLSWPRSCWLFLDFRLGDNAGAFKGFGKRKYAHLASLRQEFETRKEALESDSLHMHAVYLLSPVLEVKLSEVPLFALNVRAAVSTPKGKKATKQISHPDALPCPIPYLTITAAPSS